MPVVTGRDVDLYYESVGEGPAVLWHTGGCGDHTMWSRAGYIDALPGYRHLMFDHRGHGRSGAPADTDGYSMDRMVDDVVAALDDARVERAAMVGYSQGARVGLSLAGQHPDRLSALVALDSVPSHDSEAEELTAAAARVMAEGTRSVITEMSDSEGEPAPEWLLEHLCATDASAFAGAYHSFLTAGEFWGAADRFRVPTLFLVGVAEGEDDWEALARDAASSVRDGEVRVLRGLGHLQAFWRTDESVPPIVDFLRRRAGAAGGARG